MISDAYVIVYCDKCELSEEKMQLTATARGGYDERYLISSLEKIGWYIINDEHYCPDCKREIKSDNGTNS